MSFAQTKALNILYVGIVLIFTDLFMMFRQRVTNDCTFLGEVYCYSNVSWLDSILLYRQTGWEIFRTILMTIHIFRDIYC